MAGLFSPVFLHRFAVGHIILRSRIVRWVPLLVLSPILYGRLQMQTMQDPVLVVVINEFGDRHLRFFQCHKCADTEHLLLYRPVEPFHAAIAFRRPHEGVAHLNAQEVHLFPEVCGVVLRAVVQPQRKADSVANPFPNRSEPAFHRCSDGLHRCERACA